MRGDRQAAIVGLCVIGLSRMPAMANASATSSPSPIRHVVVLILENHSFDNVLGRFCAEVASGQLVRPGTDNRCDGATIGDMAGTTVPLTAATNIVPPSVHGMKGQQDDIDGGKMDGFGVSTNYTQFDPLSGPCAAGSCIPNLSGLAIRFTVSDRTFELRSSPSFEGHLAFAAATQDGFTDNPVFNPTGPKPVSHGGGWGCDSGSTAYWSAQRTLVPSCIPDSSGSLGPNWTGYTGPRAGYVPTIFDELSAKNKSWRIFGGAGASNGTTRFQASGYQWAICPSFAECEYTPQYDNLRPVRDLLTEAANGTLPVLSIVTPITGNSQHNRYSMSSGDNWLGTMVSAIEHGPDWPSTAVFITYDDCGCFYDHVDPLKYNSSWGVRVPMVIVSRFAKLGYTDSRPTSFAGVLAFVEHTFGLAALNSNDRSAYDYASAFCFHAGTGCIRVGTAKITMIEQPVAPPTGAQLRAQAAAALDDT
jgi:phospholipase C